MYLKPARGGFREATGIRRAPEAQMRRVKATGLSGPEAFWTAGAEGTAGPKLGNRRFPYGPPQTKMRKYCRNHGKTTLWAPKGSEMWA